MNEGINLSVLDKEGNVVNVGDTIGLFWSPPLGEPDFSEVDEEQIYQVEFKFGAMGIQMPLKFVPLANIRSVTLGEYVPNRGNKVIPSKKGNFLLVKKNEAS